jgi:glycosyltransferase involved in cell wall biosynthesis
MMPNLSKYKVAVVTFDFSPENPGGVSAVTMKILQILSEFLIGDSAIFSFCNSKNSRKLMKVSNYVRRKELSLEYKYNYETHSVYEIKPFASEFEFMRYAQQTELTDKLNEFDFVIIVTGFIQFANVIPKLKVPIFIQCATRLKWERNSQYSSMSFLRRTVLRLQTPFFAIQERKVLKSGKRFLVENSRMFDWISTRSKTLPELWYPPFPDPDFCETLEDKYLGHFVSVGRFGDRRKGWERLFDAYVRAFDEFPELPDLVVIGWGEFPEILANKISRLQNRYPIKLLANLSSKERDLYLQGASFFVQASFEEGLGLAALEALSFGTPLICSETDGSKEYVLEGVSGYLIRQNKTFIESLCGRMIDTQIRPNPKLRTSARNFFLEKFQEDISKKNLSKILEKYLD